MSENKKKGVTFKSYSIERQGHERNAYSRGTHNNRASRAEVARQFAQAGMNYSTKGSNIAYAAEYNNVLKGMRGLSLGRGGKRGSRRRSTRRKSHK